MGTGMGKGMGVEMGMRMGMEYGGVSGCSVCRYRYGMCQSHPWVYLSQGRSGTGMGMGSHCVELNT